jgi:hypothetical protein
VNLALPSAYKLFSIICYMYVTHSVMLKMLNGIYTQLLSCSPHLNSGLLHVTTAIQSQCKWVNTIQGESFKVGYTYHIMCTLMSSNPAEQRSFSLLKNNQTHPGPTQPPIQHIPRFSPLTTGKQLALATMVQNVTWVICYNPTSTVQLNM